MPDGPLLAALAAAALALDADTFLRQPAKAQAWPLWLAAGAAFGLAGLSKYSAALTGARPRRLCRRRVRARRRWFAHPAPYVAALLALAIVAPVFVWNAEHGWVSFRFQGGRGAPGRAGPRSPRSAWSLGEVAYLLPWIFAGLAAAAVAGFRARPSGDDARVFLLCLAAPPILVFTLTPLWGGRGMPHWAMPGWFFLYPLLGDWLARASAWSRALGIRRRPPFCRVGGVRRHPGAIGWVERLIGRPAAQTRRWNRWIGRRSRDAPALSPRPGFRRDHQMVGGRQGRRWRSARRCRSSCSRAIRAAWLFSTTARDFVGRDGDHRRRGAAAAATSSSDLAPISRAWIRRDLSTLGRGGRDEVEDLEIVPARGLTRAFPVPYPLGRR